MATAQLITVRNGMYGQAYHMATGISPMPAPAGKGLYGGGLSSVQRARGPGIPASATPGQ
jgi:hypothetical protein